MTNSIDICAESADEQSRRIALCPKFSRLNHSCVPNCNHCWCDIANFYRVRASEAIAAGTELAIHYIAEDDLLRPATHRRQILELSHGFVCTCAACTQGDQSNHRRAQIKELERQVMQGKASTRQQWRDHLAWNGEMLRLCDEEGLSIWSACIHCYPISSRKSRKQSAANCVSPRATCDDEGVYC